MANQITIVTLGLIFMMVSNGLGQFTCDPYTDCSAGVPGDLVPDPHDCEQYYVCVDAGGSTVPSLIPVHCDDGDYFDQVNRTCMSEEISGECINLCQNLCPNGCQGVTDGSLAAYRGDCSLYYLCALSPVLLSCTTPSIYFNGTACVSDPAQCCDFCEPFCEGTGTQIQDPCDCNSFYVCVGEGEPSEANKGTCDEGFYYAETSASCVLGQCNNFCSVEQCAAYRHREKVLA